MRKVALALFLVLTPAVAGCNTTTPKSTVEVLALGNPREKLAIAEVTYKTTLLVIEQAIDRGDLRGENARKVYNAITKVDAAFVVAREIAKQPDGSTALDQAVAGVLASLKALQNVAGTN